MSSKGRPPTYTDDTLVALCVGKRARSKLQRDSDRRAIINVVIDKGGAATMGHIDETMGFDCRSRVVALVKSGWLQILEEKKK